MSLPLPTLRFSRKADENPATADFDGVLDAIFNLLDSNTDYRGTIQPENGDCQWTVTRETGAVVALIPGGAGGAIDTKIIFAAGAAVGAATMLWDPFTAGAVMVGICKGAGAFSAWDDAHPFSGVGDWSGYTRAFPATMGALTATLRGYVSKEALFIDAYTSATTHWPLMIGACLEGWTDDGVSVEADSRLLGIVSQGGRGSALAAGCLTATFNFGDWTTNPGGGGGCPHAFVFQPGTGTIWTVGRECRLMTDPMAGGQATDASGAFIGSPAIFARSESGDTVRGNRMGRLREVYVGGLARGATTRRNGATDLFHVVGYDTANDSQGWWLKALP